ncbi:SGNH/GDSL hydrolase family protein [Engelhardtia mirabilis]|uniref:SGNH/GDSL hydrolase family protein n=1 Tax=Engelhardtia mirabilis TaxID=2528011 RepID=UPI003AF3F5F2
MTRRPSSAAGADSAHRSILKRWWMAPVAAIALLSLLEVGLRLADFDYPELKPPLLIFKAEVDAQMQRDDSLHRVDLETMWSLRPGARIDEGSDPALELVNGLGMRGPLPGERGPSHLRVASLGSSTSFGYGVEWPEIFASRVAQSFAADGRSTDVLLSGVVGHSIFQILERYRRDVKPLRPDLAIVALNGVNEHFPSPSGSDELHRERVREEFSRWEQWRGRLRDGLRVMHLIGWISDRRQGGREELVRQWLEGQERENRAWLDRGQPSFTGARRVTPQRFGELLAKLVGELRAEGTAVVVVAMPRRAEVLESSPVLAEYDRVLRERVEYLRIDFLDADALFQRLPDGPEALFLDGLHLTPLGHRRLADALGTVVRRALDRRG